MGLPLIDLQLEHTHGFALKNLGQDGAEQVRGLRCSWRLQDERRWRRFTLIADPQQTLLDLVEGALAAVASDLQRSAAA
jgi:hypothetical protein